MNKTEYIYQQIKQDIISGKLTPNQKLVEQEIAQQYSASRNTVRNSLSLLESENLIIREANKGAKVSNFSIFDVIHMLDVRIELEGYVIRTAFPNIDEEKIKMLENICYLMEQTSASELVTHSDLNNKFHYIIYEACPNQYAVQLLKDIKSKVTKYNVRFFAIPERKKITLQEHRSIIDAIKNGELEEAVKLNIEHVKSIKTSYLSHQEFF
ncbi:MULTISPECIES: GntR family transcriptional regulator [unclassified Facklamia]|uniref:GntR family transcriptional regulator n=1 Tax=Aerococcaceae TaxID=186827 RepID=UPI0013B760B7|nr:MULTISPECIES: GntR family transcriptional regulator [unclassified Facklamia]NEW64902.1 FCD domain-containing protein [Facklamia sp. 252]NEW68224.1 FCD domain-containing protein [Facklamia sp. 253]QQD66067.1 GntR family transcriptional regulator [Aerococcaceae bacterium zg-252]